MGTAYPVRTVFRWFLGAALVTAIAGCALLPADPSAIPDPLVDSPPRVARVEAVYENIDPSFWSDTSSRRDFALFLNVWVYLETESDSDIGIRDVRLYDPFDNYWTLPALVSAGGDGAFGGWVRLRDNFMSDNGAMLPLRGMRVLVERADGTAVSEPVSFPPPAASSLRERFIVSEVYRGELTAAHAFALARAEIREADVRNRTLRLTMGPVDRRATNGQVVLLSSRRELVGQSIEFYNDISREPRSFLNDGTRFRSDDLNIITLTAHEIEWAHGRSFEDAVYAYVKLRDGGQYAFTDRSASYLHLSRSRLIPISEGRR